MIEFWKTHSRFRALRVVVKDYQDIFFICQEWNAVKTALQDHSVAAELNENFIIINEELNHVQFVKNVYFDE